MFEKRWLAVFIVTCPFGLAVGQARRQDLSAGGATFLKYSIGCMQQAGNQT